MIEKLALVIGCTLVFCKKCSPKCCLAFVCGIWLDVSSGVTNEGRSKYTPIVAVDFVADAASGAATIEQVKEALVLG